MPTSRCACAKLDVVAREAVGAAKQIERAALDVDRRCDEEQPARAERLVELGVRNGSCCPTCRSVRHSAPSALSQVLR